MLSCNSLPAKFGHAALIKSCDTVQSGALRLQTLFQYPDGSFIDLFLEQTGDMLHPFRLSDYGNTSCYLQDVSIDPWSTRNRRRIIEEICERLEVLKNDGELFVYLQEPDIHRISEYMVRLCQACIRMSDLSMTKRYKVINSFKDEFEEFVSLNDVRYEPDVELDGRFGNIIRVDFRTLGKRNNCLIHTLSTQNPSAAHQLANEVFTKWYDLDNMRSEFGFISIYDSQNASFREEDIKRLETISTVLAFPAQADAIADTIAA